MKYPKGNVLGDETTGLNPAFVVVGVLFSIAGLVYMNRPMPY
jgi:hypothetical protein